MKKNIFIFLLAFISCIGCTTETDEEGLVISENIIDESGTYAAEIPKMDESEDSNKKDKTSEEESADNDSFLTYDDEILAAYNAYVDFIGDGGEYILDSHGCKASNPIFYLAYVNEDDIPEMIIKTDSEWVSDYLILMYQDGMIKSNYIIWELNIDIVSGNNIISSYLPHAVGYSYITYKFDEEGNMNEICSFVETYTDETIDEVNPLVQYYYINNEEVSNEEYELFFYDLLGENAEIVSDRDRCENIDYYPCTEEYLSLLRQGGL